MSSTPSILGVDVGGTKIALCLFEAGTLAPRKSTVVPTEADRGFLHVQDRLLSLIKPMLEPHTLAVGLGVPGFIDHASGKIVTLPNIPGAEGAHPADWLSKRISLPVTVENDARCFAYAEALLGAGKGKRVVLGVTLGTGVGGGLVIDGELFYGARGFAGEVGHMLLKPGEPPFETADKRGEVEQFLSGTALGKRCAQATNPQDYLDGSACNFLHADLYREIAWFIVNVMHLVDPSVIVLGGSVGKALTPHIRSITEELKHWLLPGITPPELVCGTREHASATGAALRAKDAVDQL
ncbi:MAG: ROK family protein [Candidatus Peribacteraceae bacterium]|nr:ROK family protein [Candidatus Peribacteraceae bacterium]